EVPVEEVKAEAQAEPPASVLPSAILEQVLSQTATPPETVAEHVLIQTATPPETVAEQVLMQTASPPDTTPPAPASPPAATAAPVAQWDGPLLRIEGVAKKFGGFRAVDGVSLDIRAGEFFALLGPSGCGKTTLLRMLAGFETPDEGSILLDGKDIAHVL